MGNLRVPGNGNSYINEFMQLEECGCLDLSHDRIFSDMRLILQSKIITFAKMEYKNKKNSSIDILSFGSGGGLQDFVILYLLVQAEVYRINLTLVDIDYQLYDKEDRHRKLFTSTFENGGLAQVLAQCEKMRNRRINSFSKINRAFSQVRLNLSVYENTDVLIQDVKSTQPKQYDIIYGIDIDNYVSGSNCKKAFDSSIKALLRENGLGLLSKNHTIITMNNQLEKKEHEIPLRKNRVNYSLT